MKNRIFLRKINLFLLLLLFTFYAGTSFGQKPTSDSSPQNIPELEEAIKKILKETKTPAAGVALVNAEGPVWIAGLGKADVEEDKEAGENTMFRIGSVSKMFVSLAILKLQEEGLLSLEDKVRSIIPEIEFTNQWEETNPVLVAHLLEHTTGWDDLHLTEYAHNDPTPVGLKEGLDFHPHSRISRWVPGTRMAYCNSGPAVAAYIVEKITGQGFEDYVQENFFEPMGMETMTYFYSDDYRQHGANLYMEEEPQKYWHILQRPSGSINASPKDMARMVSFFVNRGKADSLQLISGKSLKRMETPSTTLGAQAGMELGYGLSNYSTPYKSFVYQGHNGGVNGGLTEFSYLPEYKVGYAFSINSGSGDALYRIGNLIKEFQTKDFTERKKDIISKEKVEQEDLSGFYSAINPRVQGGYFLERLFNVQHMWNKGEHFFSKGLLGGNTQTFSMLSPSLYGSAETGKAGVALVNDPLAGEVIHMDMGVWKRTSPLVIFGQLGLGCLWLLFMISALIFAPFWLVRYKKGKISGGPNLWVRIWPLLAALSFLMLFVLMAMGFGNPFELLGKVSAVSVSIMIMTIVFSLIAVVSVIWVIKERNSRISRIIFWHSALLSGLHFVVACYLLWHGVTGLQTWT